MLKEIRSLEQARGVMVGDGVKIVMTTALGDKDNILEAFRGLCDGYLVKPIEKQKVIERLRAFALIP